MTSEYWNEKHNMFFCEYVFEKHFDRSENNVLWRHVNIFWVNNNDFNFSAFTGWKHEVQTDNYVIISEL